MDAEHDGSVTDEEAEKEKHELEGEDMADQITEKDAKIALPAEAETLGALFAKIDENQDGKMAMSEIIAFWKTTRKSQLQVNNKQDMELMDGNKDGKVSLEEFIKREDEEELSSDVNKAMKQSFEDLEKAKFKIADKNADGFLDLVELPDAVYGESHEEIVQIMAKHDMKLKDKDGDGKLDAKEFFELADEVHVGQEFKAVDGGDEKREEDDKAGKVEEQDAKMKEEEEASHQENMEEFKKQDTDGDGFLNHEEMAHYESGAFHITVDMHKLFEVADEDKDSLITLAEMNAHFAELEGHEAVNHLNEWAEHHEL